jgi:hypothetical protein
MEKRLVFLLFFLCVFLLSRFPSAASFVISLVRLLFSCDGPGRTAKESLQRAAIARTAAGNGQKCAPP